MANPYTLLLFSGHRIGLEALAAICNFVDFGLLEKTRTRIQRGRLQSSILCLRE